MDRTGGFAARPTKVRQAARILPDVASSVMDLKLVLPVVYTPEGAHPLFDPLQGAAHEPAPAH
ncbi:hypothetical protein [Pseudoxanthomonas spadix]|uniref:hypothetical protein n=1 Tax=Pseudoxanthomonas spadix TaxID=415229 RepID=UPI0011C450DC|nr:hypothetical protein [Pseudoxanthomonas spadix]MBP3973359.1 hypothetical protein [Pseudoxanthomonas spadix]